jgi:hypothetical protein
VAATGGTQTIISPTPRRPVVGHRYDRLFRLQWIVPALIALVIPLCTAVCVGVWWQTAFSWEATDTAPWYSAPLYVTVCAMLIAAPVCLVWAVVAFIKTVRDLRQ